MGVFVWFGARTFPTLHKELVDFKFCFRSFASEQNITRNIFLIVSPTDLHSNLEIRHFVNISYTWWSYVVKRQIKFVVNLQLRAAQAIQSAGLMNRG